MLSHQLKAVAKDLSCRRGARLLFDQLSFELSAKQCMHVVGSNGSGKTTLLRLVAGLNQADSGQFALEGDTGSSEIQSMYLGHLDGLKNELTAIENLRFFQQSLNVSNEAELDEILAKMNILGCADLSVSKLSFGQRRRLAFARLLLKPAPLWILDEPFTGVDADGRELIESICLEHLNQSGMIMLSNHHSLADSALSKHLVELQL